MVNKNVIIVTQARVGSSRFPEKVLQPLGEGTLLSTHLNRLKSSRLASGIVVATTFEEKSAEIIRIAQECGVEVFQGSTNDVLDRFYGAIKDKGADYIVRVTSDCPLIDPLLIDEIITMAISGNYDYVSNVLREEFPDGQDIEVFSFASLAKAWRKASLKSDREHVTPYIRRNSTYNEGAEFKSNNFDAPSNFNSIRMTVDEPNDLESIKVLVRNIGLEATWDVYTRFIIDNPSLFYNQQIQRNEGYVKSLNQDNNDI